MPQYFDALETRDPKARERALMKTLSKFLVEVSDTIPAWKKRLAKLDLSTIKSREALAQIPVLRKPELMAAQSKKPPLGGFSNPKLLQGTRYFMSPGPIWEPQASGADPWGGGRAFYAAGIGPKDLVHAAISFHMTPGGYILDAGARATGANIFPAGVGNTEQQVEAAAAIKATAYAGTPDYLKIMLDKAEEMHVDISSIKKAVVSGGALFPSMREEYRERGIKVLQNYATADLGVIAYETSYRGKPLPGMVCNENLIVEIVRPGTNEPVAHGEVGELVVTNFNPAYPLIRFGTGDLSAVLDEPSKCGRTNMRINGWMGRADQRTKVKGMFVDPKQIDELVKSTDGIAKARLVVSRAGTNDAMELQVEPKSTDSLDTNEIAKTLATITKLKGSVTLVDELPNDGKIIDDQRDYSK